MELAEQIIPELREVEVDVGRGTTVAEAVKKIGVTEQTYSLGRRSAGFGSTSQRRGRAQ
jgi:putative ubiquitin-RnfH superfamily antitoxin RatB of RatAB toxin-antitoxin module